MVSSDRVFGHRGPVRWLVVSLCRVAAAIISADVFTSMAESAGLTGSVGLVWSVGPGRVCFEG